MALRTIEPPPVSEAFNFPTSGGVVPAGRFFGLGKDGTYDAVRRGDFPCQVLKVGNRLVVTRSALLRALGLTDPGISLASAASSQVSRTSSDA